MLAGRARSYVLFMLLALMIVSLLLPTAARAQTTLRFMGWGSLLERQNVEALIRKFEEEHPNIRVQWIHVPSENYLQRLQVMIAGGTPPDVFWVGTDYYREYAKRGLLYDITPLIERDLDESIFIQPQERERMYVDGRAYGIGSTWVSMHVYYNRDVFEKMGIEPPPADPEQAWTWDQFVETAARLTLDQNGRNALDPQFDPNNVVQWGLHLATWWKPLMTVIWSHGGTVFNEDLTEFTIDHPKSIEAIQRIAELYARGIMPRDATLERIGMQPQQMLATGRVAMTIDGSWALQDLAVMDFPVGTAVLPTDVEPVTPVQAHMHSIYAGTKHPAEAWELLKFLATEEYQRALVSVGLWLPSHVSMLTDEGISQWWNPSVHPPEYRTVGVEYLLKYGRPVILPPGSVRAFQLLEQALDPVWLGRQSAESAIRGVLPEMNRALAEALK